MFIAVCVTLLKGASCSKTSDTKAEESAGSRQLDQYFHKETAPDTSAIDRGPVGVETTEQSAISENINLIEMTFSKDSIVSGTSNRVRITGITDKNLKIDITKHCELTSSNPSVIEVANAALGVIIGKSAGEADIIAKYKDLTTQRNMIVRTVSIEKIEITPKTITVGSKQQFYATGYLSDSSTQDLTDDVEWSSTNALIVNVAEGEPKGVFDGLRAGSTSIGVNYRGRIATSVVEAKLMQLTAIKVESDYTSVLFGTKVQMRAIGTFANGTNADITGSVKWSSQFPKIASVSDDLQSKGLVSTLLSGDVLINASFGGVSGSLNLTITAESFESYYFEPEIVRIPKGKKQQIKFFGVKKNGSKQDITKDVIWASSANYLAIPSNVEGEEGMIETFDSGIFTLTAVHGQSMLETNAEVTEATIVQVNIVDPPKNVVCGLDTPQLIAEGVLSDGTTTDITDAVTWAAVNTAAAVVSNDVASKGRLTTLQPGSTAITATITEAVIGMTYTGQFLLAINQPILTGYSLNHAYDSIPVGTSMPIYAFAEYSCVKTPPVPATQQVNWAISDTTYASISQDPKGLLITSGPVVTPVKVKITAEKDNFSASTEVEIRKKELVGISLNPIPSSNNVDVGKSKQWYVHGQFSDGTTISLTDGSELDGAAVSWAASVAASPFLSVSPTGLVTGILEGGFKSISATLITPEGKTLTGQQLLDVRSPCPTGKRHGLYCWFKGALGESCLQVCANNSATYVDGDVQAAGSGGSQAYCANVVQRFGHLGVEQDGLSAGAAGGLGCSLLQFGALQEIRRYTSPDTTGDAANALHMRFCSCRE